MDETTGSHELDKHLMLRRRMDSGGKRVPSNGEIEGLGVILPKIMAGLGNHMEMNVETENMVAGRNGVLGRTVVAGHGMSGMTILAMVWGSLLHQLGAEPQVHLLFVKFLLAAHKVSSVMGRSSTVFVRMKNSDFTLVDRDSSVRGVDKKDSANGGMGRLCLPGDVIWMKLPVGYMEVVGRVVPNIHLEKYLVHLSKKYMLNNHLMLELASGNLGVDSSVQLGTSGDVTEATVPVQEHTAGAVGSSAPRWSRKQWDDWEEWDRAADGSVTPDGVSLMQQPGRTNNGATGGDAEMVAGAPAQPSLALTMQEEQALYDAGWPLPIIADMREFCEFLEWARGEHGAGAVAWAMDSWGDSLVVGNATIELAQETLWGRLRDTEVVRPTDAGVRGRLVVGFAGFQRQMGDFHLSLVQEGLRGQWMPHGPEDDDGRQLPEPPFVRGDHGAWAMTRARTLAREMIQRAQARGAATRRTNAGVNIQVQVPAAPSHESGDGDAGSGGDDPAGGDDGGDEGDSSAGDVSAMMQLTVEEEQRLHERGVADEVRRQFRMLMIALGHIQERGEGPEYRWGVRMLVESWDEALQAMQVVRDLLYRRSTNLGALPYYPATREPVYGPLRTRVVAYMAEYRHLLLRGLEDEVARELVRRTRSTGSSGSQAPHRDVHHTREVNEDGLVGGEVRRLGRNTRSGRNVHPRGSRSRSRSTRARHGVGDDAAGRGPVGRDLRPALRDPPGLLPPGVVEGGGVREAAVSVSAGQDLLVGSGENHRPGDVRGGSVVEEATEHLSAELPPVSAVPVPSAQVQPLPAALHTGSAVPVPPAQVRPGEDGSRESPLETDVTDPTELGRSSETPVGAAAVDDPGHLSAELHPHSAVPVLSAQVQPLPAAFHQGFGVPVAPARAGLGVHHDSQDGLAVHSPHEEVRAGPLGMVTDVPPELGRPSEQPVPPAQVREDVQSGQVPQGDSEGAMSAVPALADELQPLSGDVVVSSGESSDDSSPGPQTLS
ncbi:unnamed protein product [Symbiodinium sp. CCMP2592]|nr:unnamed protein product [Symbiodinium sp. CCMP2592]